MRRAALLAVLCLCLAGFAWLALAYTDGGTVVGFDVRVAEWVAGSMPSWAEWLARPFTWLGGAIGLPVVTVVAAVWLLRAGRRWDAVFLVAVLVGTEILVRVLKNTFERARPDQGSAIPLPHSYSFPSGHAASSVAVLGTIAVLLTEGRDTRRRVLVIGSALAVAFCVGASRVVLNVHYVSDVLAGYCLGLAVLSGALLVRDALRAPALRREHASRAVDLGDGPEPFEGD